jgi:3-phosphoshikimate 1-carboxyvinyltransferase
LLCASLAHGISHLDHALQSDDTLVMIRALQRLGTEINEDWERSAIQITGLGGEFSSSPCMLNVENSGTTVRFLTAVLGVAGGRYRLAGDSRMHQRPIGPLVSALRDLGAQVRAESPGDCPPVEIDSERIDGGSVSISGDVSSQYLSGLMMAGPLSKNGLRITIVGRLVSKPYVAMTAEVMQQFGVRCEIGRGFKTVEIAAGETYRAARLSIEPDASAASYFWAAAAICGGRARVLGLSQSSLQGDVRFVQCLSQMGCQVRYLSDSIEVTGPAKSGIDVDMSDISDTVLTLSAVALFVEGPTRIRGVAHNRAKESDRIGDMAKELRKLGATIHEFDDGMEIIPGRIAAAEIETYNDHRMAMSLSLVGLRQPGIVIRNPACVAKTYPKFFDDLERISRT